jgi:hypothetical protein
LDKRSLVATVSIGCRLLLVGARLDHCGATAQVGKSHREPNRQRSHQVVAAAHRTGAKRQASRAQRRQIELASPAKGFLQLPSGEHVQRGVGRILRRHEEDVAARQSADGGRWVQEVSLRIQEGTHGRLQYRVEQSIQQGGPRRHGSGLMDGSPAPKSDHNSRRLFTDALSLAVI